MASSISEVLRHPEVELRLKVLGNEWAHPEKDFVTSLDLLEVYPDGKAIIKKDMGQADFATYCNTNDFEGTIGPTLRVFFIEELYLPPHLPVEDTENTSTPFLKPGDQDMTALLLHKHFAVPMLFFRYQPPFIAHSTSGNVTFVRRNEEGTKTSLDGYYQFCSDYQTDKSGYVWFSQSFEPKTRASNYVVHKAPAVTKRLIFECAQGSYWSSLTRPFSIDTFLVNDWIMQMTHQITYQRSILIGMERTAMTPPQSSQLDLQGQSVKDKRTLYVAAREFRFMRDNLDTVKDTLDYLLEALKQTKNTNSGFQTSDPDRESIQSSLILLISKAKWTTRELSSLEDRAKLIVDLENSLAMNQRSPINLDRAGNREPDDSPLKIHNPEKGVSDSSSTVVPSTVVHRRPWRKFLPDFLLKMVNLHQVK